MMHKEKLARILLVLGSMGGLTVCAPYQPTVPFHQLSLPVDHAVPIVEHSTIQPYREPGRTKLSIPLTAPATEATPLPTPIASDSSDVFPDKHKSRFSSNDKLISTISLADLWLYPRSGIVSRTRFFTSACFGPNSLQKEDFLKPLDWWVSKRVIGPSNTCNFGFDAGANGQPNGNYSVGNYDGLPLYYIVPPDAIEITTGRLVLSEVSLIVEPAPFGGWESLGFIVLSVDGVIFKGWAADVFRPGGTIASADGTKIINFPTNENIVFNSRDNGGNYGFAGFPMMIAEKNLSFAFTGSPVGGPPPKIYFAVRVDELDPRMVVKTTAQMSNKDLSDLAGEFDRRLDGIDRIAEIAKLEKNLPAVFPEIGLLPNDEANFEFSPPSGSILSSVHLFMWPQNNNQKQDILEINPNIVVDGKVMYPGTGFEDFGGEAFYSGGTSPLGAFFPIDHEGYFAVRYLLIGPIIHDSKIYVRLKNPDVGTAIKLRVEVRVIEPDTTVLK